MALAAPILPLLNRFVRAEDTVRPRNLILVYHQNGLEYGWQPTVGASPSQITLSERLMALEPWKDRLTSIGGVQNGISREVLAHNQGTVSMWTGFFNESAAGMAYSPYDSIDQIVANRISNGLPFRSLELGVQANRISGVGPGDNSYYTIYRDGTYLPAEDDPAAVYMRVFGGAAGSPEQLMAARRRRRSVLDFHTDDLAAIRRGYGMEEQPKIEAHLESIREIERRLDIDLAETCDPTVFVNDVPSSEINDRARLDRLVELQSELLSLCLSCGMTRVASLQFFSSLGLVFTPRTPTMPVHSVMHAGSSSDRRAINTWFVEGVAKLAHALEADVDPVSQRSLLDDTLIVWSTDMAVGNHLPFPVPLFLLGGEQERGFFLPGHFDFPERVRHTRVLMSVLEAFQSVEGEQEYLGDFRDELSRFPLTRIHREA